MQDISLGAGSKVLFFLHYSRCYQAKNINWSSILNILNTIMHISTQAHIRCHKNSAPSKNWPPSFFPKKNSKITLSVLHNRRGGCLHHAGWVCLGGFFFYPIPIDFLGNCRKIHSALCVQNTENKIAFTAEINSGLSDSSLFQHPEVMENHLWNSLSHPTPKLRYIYRSMFCDKNSNTEL